MSENKNYLVPIAFLGLMFFSCGFALGINSLLVPVLQESLSVPSAGAYLLIGATFIPFLIFGYPAGGEAHWLQAHNGRCILDVCRFVRCVHRFGQSRKLCIIPRCIVL